VLFATPARTPKIARNRVGRNDNKINTLIMKRFAVIALSFIFLFAFGCKKEKTATTSNLESSGQARLIAQIKEIGDKTSKDRTNYANRINWDKAVKMGIADAIGGAMAPKQPVVGPYLILWSAFFASVGIGSLLSPVMPTPIIQPKTNSSNFISGYLGDDHNILLFDAYSNAVSIGTSNGSLNLQTSTFLIAHGFSNITGQTPASYLPMCTNSMANVYNYTVSVANDPNVLVNLLNYSLYDPTVKPLISVIIDGVTNSVDNPDDCNAYLLSVQAAVQSSSTLSSDQKSELYNFLAIANSSLYFWNANT
jgi:hypothetical protein